MYSRSTYTLPPRARYSLTGPPAPANGGPTSTRSSSRRWKNSSASGFVAPGFQPALGAGKDAGGTGKAAKTAELRIRNRGHLPHWEEEGGTYFVTFRLADSLPQAVLQSFEFERRKIVQTAERQGRDFSETERKRLSKLFSERIEALSGFWNGSLPSHQAGDRGHGCKGVVAL